MQKMASLQLSWQLLIVLSLLTSFYDILYGSTVLVNFIYRVGRGKMDSGVRWTLGV